MTNDLNVMKLTNSISNHERRYSPGTLLRQHWQDIVYVIAIAAIAGLISYIGAHAINPAVTWDKQTTDTWFNNDTTRAFDDMAVYQVDHYRTNLHPLFVMLTMPFVYALRSLFSLDAVTAVRIVLAANTSIWFGVLFITLRLIGCRRFDATLISILAAVSAASVFWFTMPETYPFGSTTLLLVPFLVALAEYQKLSPLWYVLVGVLTLGITITNWMAAIFAAFVKFRLKPAALITIASFIIVSALVLVQKAIFPAFNAGFLRLWSNASSEAGSTGVLKSEFGGPMTSIKCVIFDTIVMPAIGLVKDTHGFAAWPSMTVQWSSPGSGSTWGAIAVILWIAVFSLGIWGLFSIRQQRAFRIVLGLSLLGQIVLEAVYGDERFPHATHILPFVILIAALSTLTKARVLALVLTGALILTAGVNNLLLFEQARAFTYNQGPLRQVEPAPSWINLSPNYKRK